MTDIKVPNLTREQVEALDALFPEQCADLNWNDRTVWYKSGQRSVVRFLMQQLAIQEENILESPEEVRANVQFP